MLILFCLIYHGISADWLSTDGKNVIDENGKTVRLTGLNWFGYNCQEEVLHGLWSGVLETIVSEVADRGFNIFRVPISAECVQKWKAGVYDAKPNVNTYANPSLEGKNNLEILDIFVAECKKNGIKIFFDFHSVISDNAGHFAPVWYSSEHPASYIIEAETWLANYYKDEDTVIGFDVKNEPHGDPSSADGGAKWDDSNDVNNWKKFVEDIAASILKANPKLLILVEGIQIFEGHGAWWGGNFRGEAVYPINLGDNQKQLVFSPHDYGPSVSDQSWFHDGYTIDSIYEEYWRDNWMFIWDNNIAPLLIGEWGGFLTQPNVKWMGIMCDLIEQKGLSHTFWCLNPNSGDTGGLLQNDWSTWENDKYEFIKRTLWQTSGGKFIGLSDTVPLGKNGVTRADA